ncbi:MAG: ribosome-associated protein [Abditibacteriota bacterium]|jgi:ribosome-associated protein|nr:ribosome-associated protein [Abditibacteriota bacterium]
MEEIETDALDEVLVTGNAMDSEETMRMVCRAADEAKAHEITVMDVRGQTIVADFFVVCTGTSTTHIQSISEGVQDKLREWAQARAKREGGAQSFWMILDYGDVILHVFDEGTREFYDLEHLWADAKVTTWASSEDDSSTASSEDTTDSSAAS